MKTKKSIVIVISSVVILLVFSAGALYAGRGGCESKRGCGTRRACAVEESTGNVVNVNLVQAFTWASAPPADCPFEQSKELSKIVFTMRHKEYDTADTWYPSWAADGNLYSPFTDGSVKGVHSWSGDTKEFKITKTGNAKIVGDDPMNLDLIPLGTEDAVTEPYHGRYPCGSLIYNGVWYYGTYCLETKKNPWDILGPFVGYRISKDYGKSWIDCPRLPKDNIFSESGLDGNKVKIGSPHFVDFGKNMEHSPDGKAYLVAHGATRPESTPSWISGDEIYLYRVTPTPENINDPDKYEFFAGYNWLGKAKWTKNFKKIKPLFKWNDHAGCVTMTYNAPLKKYLMCVTWGGKDAAGPCDTYILESDEIAGPFKLVTFMEKFGEQGYFVNFPSKFISDDGKTAWLCYAHNWQGTMKTNPPAGFYTMNMQEVKLGAPDENTPPDDPKRSEANIAPLAKATASSSAPLAGGLEGSYKPSGATDRSIGHQWHDEWATPGEKAWFRLDWDEPQTIDRVLLHSRLFPDNHIEEATLTFSDGTSIAVKDLPDDGVIGKEYCFAPRTIQWLKLDITKVTGSIGLSEILVFKTDKGPKPK